MRAVSTKDDARSESPKQPEESKKQMEGKKTNTEKEITPENRTTISKLAIPIDLRNYVRNEKYLTQNIKSLEDHSGTNIIISHNYDKIIIEGTAKNIDKVVHLLDKNGSGSLDTPSWKL